MQTYTARQIARLVQKPHEKIETTMDRLDHWTHEGMLSVYGDRNPGTGRRRLYERRALFEALTLSLLSEAVGSPVTASDQVKVLRASLPGLKFETDKKAARFLVAAFSRSKGAEIGTASGRFLAEHIASSPHEAHVVIDFWTLNQRVKEFELGESS